VRGESLPNKEINQFVKGVILKPSFTIVNESTCIHLPFSNFTVTVFPYRLIFIIYPFRSIVSITNQSEANTSVV